MKSLSDFIKSKVVINDKDLKTVLAEFEEKTYSSNQIILKQGQIANQYYFINSGTLRFFSMEDEGEHTAWAFFAGEFVAEISSLAHRTPTRFNIQAVEETQLMVIERSSMEDLYKMFPVWQEFGRKVWEDKCIQQIDQNMNYQTLTAEGVYLKLMQNPDFIKKISVKQLANILGITPNALSRIRRNIK